MGNDEPTVLAEYRGPGLIRSHGGKPIPGYFHLQLLQRVEDASPQLEWHGTASVDQPDELTTDRTFVFDIEITGRHGEAVLVADTARPGVVTVTGRGPAPFT